ncbi:MAG: cysteine hydrolase [Deltaproteobacteria bacterium]|nr:cysteine hydrolase [Deltaproteobacteria bacterium]
MKSAILVIDMVKDTLDGTHSYPITPQAMAMLPALNHLLIEGRRLGSQIIFSTDSFLEEDFIFKGRMKAHSIRGTKGAETIDELDQRPGDIHLPKRRFSAFFKTDLDQTLRVKGIELVAVTGIATNFCVLATALDALCHDFRAVIIEDCAAAFDLATHTRTVDNYRRNPLNPLFRIMTSHDFLQEQAENAA